MTAINAMLGIVIGLLCRFLEVPNALLWGTMVALFNYLRRGVPATWEVAEGTRA